MKKSKWLPVLGMVVGLTMALCSVPVLANGGVTVSVNAPATVSCGGSFTASVDITDVTAFAASEFTVEFDSTVIAVTGVTDGLLGSSAIHVDGYATPWQGDPNKMKVLVSWPPLYPGVSGAGNLCQINFNVIGTAGQTSNIDLTDGLIANDSGLPIAATWVGTTVTVGPCGPFAPVLVSGTTDFVPQDEFAPGEDVYVWGTGLEASQDYEIYIQPYQENVAVAEGQALDPNAGAPLGYTPILVTSAADGSLAPVKLFTAAPQHVCMYWEIVADKVDGAKPDVYNAADDALDAAALGQYGFHVFPEALTIALFGLGLAGLSGFVLARRRKSAGNA